MPQARADSDVALLFAYGTLCDPAQLAALLGRISNWRRVGDGSVQGRLYDAGHYPALVTSDDPAERVPGIIIELAHGAAALARLDAYEDVDRGLYRRELMAAQCGDGTKLSAWTYIYLRSVDRLRRISGWPTAV